MADEMRQRIDFQSLHLAPSVCSCSNHQFPLGDHRHELAAKFRNSNLLGVEHEMRSFAEFWGYELASIHSKDDINWVSILDTNARTSVTSVSSCSIHLGFHVDPESNP